MTKAVSLVFAAMMVASASAQDVTTNRYDNVRSAATAAETTLTPANVNSAQFGKLCSYAVGPADGTPADQYAQPLVVRNVSIPGNGVHDVVYTATQANDVFAFDANCSASAPLWQVNLGPPIPTSETPLGGDTSIRPGVVGVMGTPVIDAAAGTLYVLSRTKLAVSSYAYRLHALDISTGAEKLGGPITVSAVVPGTGYDHTASNTIVFNPLTQNHRAGLALACGKVYFGFSSYADSGFYHGWVMAYDASTLQRVAVFNASPNGYGNALWMSGGAPAVDPSCNLYVATGNGSSNGSTDFSESLLKLSPALALLDWYRPSSGDDMDLNDDDFGVSPITLMPTIDAVAQGGKLGQYHLARMSNLGHTVAGDTQLRQLLNVGGTQLHSQAVWTSAAGPRFYTWGSGDRLKSFTWNGSAFASTSQSPLAVRAGILSVSSNGISSGIVWSCMPYDASAFHDVVNGICRAYDANDLTQELWNSKQVQSRDEVGNYAKFVMPVINNGKLYVATFSNLLHVYGLLPLDPVTYRIGGVVTYNGAPVSGVSFAIVNGGTCTTSDAAGSYSCTVNSGWGGTITPSKAGFTFIPRFRTYNNVQSNLGGHGYAASPTTAAFVGSDTSTQGNWRGHYGADGYAVIDDSANYPVYAVVNPSGNSDHVWAARPDTEARALQRASAGRIAACWNATSRFDIDVVFTDTAVHQVALYFLDWDSTARIVRVDVLDADSQQVLSTQTVLGFNSGAYAIWNVQGHVVFRLTNQGGANAVVSGIFFDAPSGATSSVTTLTSSANPAVAGADVTLTAAVTGSAPTGNVSFLDGGNPICTAVALTGTGNTRTAMCSTASLAVGLHDILAAYGGDASNSSSQSAVLSQRINAVEGAAATFMSTDATTHGNWRGRYGADGYSVFGDSASYPAYVLVNPTGKGDYVWASRPDTEVRALQRAATGRIAACWFGQDFNIDVNLTDGASHQVTLYLLDWDNVGRVTRVDVLDATSQLVLSTQTVSSYAAGKYLSWSARGHVVFRVTSQGGANAVASGLFFDPIGAAGTFTVSGTVTGSAAALSGVSFTVTNAGSCTASDAAGRYTCTVPSGWSGTVTPTLTGYTFTPPSRAYTNVAANQAAQDYVGATKVASTITVNACAVTVTGNSPTGTITCTATYSGDANNLPSTSAPLTFPYP